MTANVSVTKTVLARKRGEMFMRKKQNEKNVFDTKNAKTKEIAENQPKECENSNA